MRHNRTAVSRRVFLKSAGMGAAVAGVATVELGRFTKAQPLGVAPNGTGGYVVTPSGDLSGLTDADNIEWAIENTASGATVSLAAGHFYTSREIYSEGFDGKVKGTGVSGTIIEAVRQGPNPGEGFQPVFTFPAHMSNPSIVGEPRTSIFMFVRSDDSDLTVTDMTLKCDDLAPCDPVKMWNVPNLTCLAAFINDFFGYGKTATFERIRMQGVRTIDAVHPYGTFNCATGLIAWPGNLESGTIGPGQGVLAVKDCEFEKVAYGLYVLYYGGDLSSFTVEGVRAREFLDAAYVEQVSCPVVFKGNAIEGMLRGGLVLGSLPDVQVSKNTFRDFNIAGADLPYGGWPQAPIYLYWGVQHGVFENNKFINIHRETADTGPARAAVRITSWGNHSNVIKNNNYVDSGLPGWNPDYSGGPGCVLIHGSQGNVLGDHNYPPGTDMCQQIKDMGVETTMPLGWQGVCNPVPDEARDGLPLNHQPRI